MDRLVAYKGLQFGKGLVRMFVRLVQFRVWTPFCKVLPCFTFRQ